MDNIEKKYRDIPQTINNIVPNFLIILPYLNRIGKYETSQGDFSVYSMKCFKSALAARSEFEPLDEYDDEDKRKESIKASESFVACHFIRKVATEISIPPSDYKKFLHNIIEFCQNRGIDNKQLFDVVFSILKLNIGIIDNNDNALFSYKDN